MDGINNGVFSKLKKDVPSLILIKCACHSLPLAVSYAASESLPRTFLIAESTSGLIILVSDNKNTETGIKP